MTEANRNLVLRIVSAVVVLPLALVLLWWQPWGIALLLAAVAAILALEFYGITLRKLEAGQLLGVAAAAAFPVVCALWPARFPEAAVIAIAALLLMLYAYYLMAGPLPEAPARVSLVLTGAIYCGLLPSSIAAMRALPDGLLWIFLTLLVTWSNDTGAYAFGRAFGRHKLYPKVSPGKTWEGFFGGAATTVVAALVAKATFFPALSLVDCLLVGVPASILGPIGDLSESMLKRAYGVKDSGKIMPGHGGMLDRVDAVLFNAPYVFLYAALWHSR